MLFRPFEDERAFLFSLRSLPSAAKRTPKYVSYFIKIVGGSLYGKEYSNRV